MSWISGAIDAPVNYLIETAGQQAISVQEITVGIDCEQLAFAVFAKK